MAKKSKKISRANMKPKKEKRPPIPDDVKLELWARAGGRCQFRGCNKPVWYDGITMSTLNHSNIAHIISWTPTGPRGCDIKSKKLGKDISNLMLTCPSHNKEIDSRKYVGIYSVEDLLQFKKEHEERIEIVTDINSNSKSELIVFKANIADRAVEIDYQQAKQAALPFYPEKMQPLTIDLTSIYSTTKNYWEIGLAQIEEKVERLLDRDSKQIQASHLSVFALGPIPFLIKLGASLGDTIPVRLYQKHRDTDDWCWKKLPKYACPMLVKNVPSKLKTKHVALVFSLSGKIHLNEYSTYIKDDWEVQEISVSKPETSFLKIESQLLEFRTLYRKLLTNIRSKYGSGVCVHIFPAVPAPIAVEIGRSLLPKSDPDIYVYDKQKSKADQFVLIAKL